MWINVEFHPLLLSTNFSQVRIHLAKLLSCGWPTVDRTNRRPTRDKVLAANLILGVMWARGCCWLTLAAAEEVCLDGAMASVMSGSGENISSLKKEQRTAMKTFLNWKHCFALLPTDLCNRDTDGDTQMAHPITCQGIFWKCLPLSKQHMVLWTEPSGIKLQLHLVTFEFFWLHSAKHGTISNFPLPNFLQMCKCAANQVGGKAQHLNMSGLFLSAHIQSRQYPVSCN